MAIIVLKAEWSGPQNAGPKDLEGFVSRTMENGGYYLARYEASGGSGNTTETVKSQYDKAVWTNINQPIAATNCQNMYSGNSFIESDLSNGYSWDTAIIFIQKYSGNSNYAKKKSVNTSKLNTGMSGDVALNIHDIASNCREWSTETGGAGNNVCYKRGAGCDPGGNGASAATRVYANLYNGTGTEHIYDSFRTILYLK